ncbi:MAG: HAMP domain-containing protein [Rhodoferax sp.]|uniref:sensor histidine kinase n=1 Tax=Rhodoferax sp. TaxID=50421 RepID=UPI0014012FEE|nr:ATP-binding protein [Rhodoferax sp.]NDP40810.1 HAMP domain-containing protein [Rhodoferax sp.]
MRSISLRVKISLYLSIVLSVVAVLFTMLFVEHREEELQGEISRHVTQISDVIIASTRHAMLVNERDIAGKIIEDIGKQKGIERVRVINKDGTIIHSNRASEVGYSVEQQDEPCVQCHQTSPPMTQVSDDKRWKIVETGGHRVLSSMQAIRNEPSCSSASCHEHSASQSVLGIVDLAYSLEEMDQSRKTHTIHVIGMAGGFILIFAISIGVLLQRLIYVPLKDLDAGANEIAAGRLDQNIPVRSKDEFGRVAASFNHMTDALQASRSDMQDMLHTLESKVTERTRELMAAKAEVAQGEKLASIGVLASGIAHELNNPLTGVLTFTSLMRKKAAEGSEDAADLDLVIRETKRCASIIRRLLDFAREKVPVKGFFNLNLVVEDTVRFVERPASLQHIEIMTALDPALPQIWGDADLMKQVVMNLLVNAQQAIEGQGRITVATRLCPSTDSDQPGVDASPMVEVSVTDTGCGIPPDNLERIFDPFFTSKEVGKGTGLGLSVSYGIIKAHGGKITVDSVVDEGTTFHVCLPIKPPFDEAENHMAASTP